MAGATGTGGWTVTVDVDRAYYNSAWAPHAPPEAIIRLPGDAPIRHIALSGTEMLIGRHSATRRIHPEIDLTMPEGGPPTDTAVNREHARLVARPDGSWSVIDLGSVNGTVVNGWKIEPGRPVPLHDGDLIILGMWTAITITRAPSREPDAEAGDLAPGLGGGGPSGTGTASSGPG